MGGGGFCGCIPPWHPLLAFPPEEARKTSPLFNLWGFSEFTWRACSGPPGLRDPGTIAGLRACAVRHAEVTGRGDGVVAVRVVMAHGFGWPKDSFACSTVSSGTWRWETVCCSRVQTRSLFEGLAASLGAGSGFRRSAGQHWCRALCCSRQACCGGWAGARSVQPVHPAALQASSACWQPPPAYPPVGVP